MHSRRQSSTMLVPHARSGGQITTIMIASDPRALAPMPISGGHGSMRYVLDPTIGINPLSQFRCDQPNHLRTPHLRTRFAQTVSPATFRPNKAVHGVKRAPLACTRIRQSSAPTVLLAHGQPQLLGNVLTVRWASINASLVKPTALFALIISSCPMRVPWSATSARWDLSTMGPSLAPQSGVETGLHQIMSQSMNTHIRQQLSRVAMHARL